MALSTLPLSYCTNVHPGRSLAEVEAGLDRYTVPVRDRFGGPLAAGLWLAQPVVRELLADPAGVPRFAERLQARGLACHTLNAFPYGDFHGPRVKERVYVPDWTRPERLEYTVQCGQVLAALLAEGAEGSLSTVPLGFKGFDHPPDFESRTIGNLVELARRFARLHDETGKVLRLAIEPEPLCLLETTEEAVAFFARLWHCAEAAGALDAVRRHIGVCYDVCHQSVEFEDVAASIRSLAAAGVRINKVHITCAIELDRPAENAAGRRALAQYVEPRYLHQTTALLADGTVLRAVDLTEDLVQTADAAFLRAEAWRVHFHVPVDAERLGPLATTRADLKRALETVAGLEHAPHLEVETYTWEVLPDGAAADLVDGLTRELTATRHLLQSL